VQAPPRSLAGGARAGSLTPWARRERTTGHARRSGRGGDALESHRASLRMGRAPSTHTTTPHTPPHTATTHTTTPLSASTPSATAPLGSRSKRPRISGLACVTCSICITSATTIPQRDYHAAAWSDDRTTVTHHRDALKARRSAPVFEAIAPVASPSFRSALGSDSIPSRFFITPYRKPTAPNAPSPDLTPCSPSPFPPNTLFLFDSLKKHRFPLRVKRAAPATSAAHYQHTWPQISSDTFPTT
jgi:hypothetical protein